MSVNETLASLALSRSGASRVFHRHRLDFCCKGGVSLADACAARELDADALLAEIDAVEAPPVERDWAKEPVSELIDHLLERFHASHREEVPRLLSMARKVERVHAAKPDCPHGLADTLERVGQELESHMQKEEQILFPLMREGQRPAAPIACMEREHDDHARNLELLREKAHDYVPPMGACTTWRALYSGLAELEHEVMRHVHLENHVLFKSAP